MTILVKTIEACIHSKIRLLSLHQSFKAAIVRTVEQSTASPSKVTAIARSSIVKIQALRQGCRYNVISDSWDIYTDQFEKLLQSFLSKKHLALQASNVLFDE